MDQKKKNRKGKTQIKNQDTNIRNVMGDISSVI